KDELDDYYSIDSTHGIVARSKKLTIAPELSLTFAEWFQGWARLRELIQTYLPGELQYWLVHYERILNHPNQRDEWPICLGYCSEVRRRSCTSALDPSVFHLTIWNDQESKFMARVTLQTVRAELNIASGSSYAPKSHGPSKSNTRHNPSNPNVRYHPYKESSPPRSKGNSFRGNPNHLQITAGPGGDAHFRCFICADPDPSHRSRFCTARKLTNGNDAILTSRKPGDPRTDRNGVSYCYSWNGRSGCDQGTNCSHGKHWCSLCGSKDGSHAAQICPAV
ncbi:hypothetical protein DFH09DRAFT_1228301, partial [Mycena vulgaris]